MLEFIEMLNFIEASDSRQQSKVKHRLKDILVIVLFATFADSDDWVEIALYAKVHQEYLRKYIKLENGVPSHDTIQRAMALIDPGVLQQLQGKFQELMNQGEGEKIKKIIAVDGKTMRGNKQGENKPLHVVSAWCKEDGFCLGQEAVDEKSNEITAIPELLNRLNIQRQIITIDAMGTQTEIAKTIRNRKADYVLALKGNQPNLYHDVQGYFEDKEFQKKVQDAGGYKKTVEKAHGQQEIREYYQTDDIKWLKQRNDWSGLKTIGMERKTLKKNDGTETIEYRHYISSLPQDIETFSRAVRGHWSVESMHWHLDVTFREDANKTIDKSSAQNLNIVRKFCLSVLKLVDVVHERLSMKKKRFLLGQATERFMDIILSL